MKETICPALGRLPKDPRRRAAAVNKALAVQFPDSECTLSYEGDPFRLLVMARLSAQCTDKRVNQTAPALFAALPDAAAFAAASQEEVEELVRPCGLFRRVHVRFGRPIPLTDLYEAPFNNETAAAVLERMRESILALASKAS